MSSYLISTKLKSNRVFILQKNELEKRFDPKFYTKEYKDNLDKIKRNDYKRLGDVAKFSSETWNQKDFFKDTFPYIEISEIDTLSGEIQNFTQVEISAAASRAKMIVRENDIILSTTRPNRGAISLITKKQDFSIASTGFSIIRNITDPDINREYLFAILRQQISLKQFEQRSSGGNYPAITQEELSNVIIPFANKENQEKVINIFQNSFSQKQKIEKEAQNLLLSIDDYLLQALDIKLPMLVENSLKSRMFIKTFSEISDSRMDPHFHQEKFKQLDVQLSKGRYPLTKLKKKSILITSGATPLSKGDSYTEDASIGVPFVRSGEIKDITFEDCIYIKPKIHNTMLKSSQLKNGDLLIAIVGATIGEIGIYNHTREANINQAIALVRLNDELLPTFAKDFFKSSIGGFILDRAKRPVARANINLDEIGTLPIVLPPLDIQKEIADHITGIRNQAREIKEKANELLKKASEEIEFILFS